MLIAELLRLLYARDHDIKIAKLVLMSALCAWCLRLSLVTGSGHAPPCMQTMTFAIEETVSTCTTRTM